MPEVLLKLLLDQVSVVLWQSGQFVRDCALPNTAEFLLPVVEQSDKMSVKFTWMLKRLEILLSLILKAMTIV
ncbi:hypothetical protein [Scytonema sp. UIC 10036]|uniref:hypothetical protein n=1 Tax=Scytonema sp. UIC 10036 TaxID=2304196 RepID=UPI001A9B6542|nr:hypothetical protein [Scytonema sp. UIC 10036]